MLHPVSEEPSGLEAPTVAIFYDNYKYSQICHFFYVPRTKNVTIQWDFSSFYKKFDITTPLNFYKAHFQPIKNSIKVFISQHYINLIKSVFFFHAARGFFSPNSYAYI
jgi:hypothetical protein